MKERKTWAQQIVECIEDESKRHYLKSVPIVLLTCERLIINDAEWENLIYYRQN